MSVPQQQPRRRGRPPASTATAGFPARPPERRGAASTGRIVDLRTGQGHGFIRVGSREIYFHRSDVEEGTSFNDFVVGQTVAFELLEDRVSGARALRVKRRRSSR